MPCQQQVSNCCVKVGAGDTATECVLALKKQGELGFKVSAGKGVRVSAAFVALGVCKGFVLGGEFAHGAVAGFFQQCLVAAHAGEHLPGFFVCLGF